MLPYNNLLFNNTSSFIYDSGYQDLTTISGTITADPQMVNFVLTGGGDYHLKSGSAAINEGTTACASDKNPKQTSGIRMQINFLGFMG